MTKQQFIKNYCERSGITEQEFLETQVALPCNCDYEDCEKWAAVSNNKLSIKAHNELNPLAFKYPAKINAKRKAIQLRHSNQNSAKNHSKTMKELANTPEPKESNIVKVLQKAFANFKTHFNRDPVSITMNPFTYKILNEQVYIKADDIFEKPADSKFPELAIQIGSVIAEIIINHSDQSDKQSFEIN
jgi:hypothetical protein